MGFWAAAAPAIISAVGSIAGGALGNNSQKKANQQNIDFQREMAQNSIQYRVQDARNAGIHPLYALGAQPYQASPSSVGFDWSNSVGGAFNAVASGIQNYKANQQQIQMNQLQIENMKLKNQALQNEIFASKFGQTMDSRGASQVPVFNQSVPTSGQLDGSDIASNIPGFAKKVGSFYQLEGVAGKANTFTAGVQQDKADLVSEDLATKAKHYKLMHNPFATDRQELISRQLTAEAHARGEIPKDEILIPRWAGLIDGWEYIPVKNTYGRSSGRASYLGAKYRHRGVYYGE